MKTYEIYVAAGETSVRPMFQVRSKSGGTNWLDVHRSVPRVPLRLIYWRLSLFPLDGTTRRRQMCSYLKTY